MDMKFVSAVPALLTTSLVLLLGSSLDILLILLFETYKHWDFVQQFVRANINPTIVIDASKYATALFTILQVARYIIGLSRSGSCRDEFPVKPLLFPCQTSHVRIFPKKHGFSYSYLLVGIPVGWNGNFGGMISAEEEENRPWYLRWFSLKPGMAWWTVNSDHYLGRGHEKDGLAGKLREYLESQGIDHKQYAYAYLLTAARFLNYASNPVSVWHLYSAKKELKALVLEVNNTSDERRIYFLEPSATKLLSKDPNLPEAVRYTGIWNKDFYVSTFNDRAGKYSVAAYDPLFPFMSRTGPVNTTITLNSPDSRAMLIARVYSAGQALDPSYMSIWAKTRFLASWWWVGFMTFFPRTVFEAFRLFVRRGMPWVSRPEPREETMPRRADAREICIEKHFRAFINDRVLKSGHELSIRYIPAGLVGSSSGERMIRSNSVQEPTLTLRILTPLFYTRIVQYTDVHAGLLLEMQSKTISISDPAHLKLLGFNSRSSPKLSKFSRIGMCLRLIKHLRATVPAIPLLEKPDAESEPLQIPQYPSHGLSDLDQYVSATASRSEKYGYASGVLKLLLAERFGLGWMEILDLEIFVLRIVGAWVLVRFVVP